MVTQIGAKIVTAKLASGSRNRVPSEPLNRPSQGPEIVFRPFLSKAQALEPAMARAPAPTNDEWVERPRRHELVPPTSIFSHFLHRHAFQNRDGAANEAPPLAPPT